MVNLISIGGQTVYAPDDTKDKTIGTYCPVCLNYYDQDGNECSVRDCDSFEVDYCSMRCSNFVDGIETD